MEARFTPPIMCPVLIGRVQDLTHLHLLVDRAHSRQGQVALVSGEAGIGKSRLVAEAKAYAAAHDFLLLLQGQCFQTDSALPYAPLLDLFRSYFARLTRTSLPDTMHSFAFALSRLLPELALLFPDLATLPTPPSVNPEEEKRWLFAAMTHFLMEQAGRHPVLLVVEDVHWCDDLSLDFLLHLARRCRHVPLLLLVTYRSEELHPRLRRWLTQLDRERLAEECSLERLSRADVVAMLQAMLDLKQRVDADLLDTLYARSEGNPFFVEELLKSLMTTGELVSIDGTWKRTTRRAPIPRSVQEAVQQRTAYLSADAKRLLTLAAVAGRRFNVTLLQEVMHCDEAHLLALLKEVMAAQLVIEEAADQFAFRHALTQQAITAELLLRERQGLHRSIAETLERFSTSSPISRERYLEDLTYHCYEAGMWEQALAYAQEVGEKALTLYAQQAAIDHLTQAVEAAHHLSQTPPAHLYQARGQAYETLGDFERARGDYERALDAARTVHDGRMEWQSMLSLGFLWTGHDYERAGVWFRQALALAEKLSDPTLYARSLNRLGDWLQNTGRIQEALEAHQEALRLFEMQQNIQGMAETLEMLGMAYFFTGDPASGVKEFFGRSIELFRTLGDRQSLFSTLAGRAIDSAPETIETTFSALRAFDECMQDAEEALLLARQTNSQSGQAFVEMATTWVLSSFGEFGPAFVHAQEALRIATTIEHQEWIAATNGALGQLYLLLLDPDRAVACLEAGLAEAQALGSAIWIGYLTPYLALAYLLRREFPRVEATLKTVISHEQQPGNFFERQVARVWGELALAQGEAARALAIAEHLLVSAPGDAHQQPIPHLLALKGEALLALKRLEEAAQALEDAKLGAEQRQAPSVLWRIHRALGRVYHLLKREEQAQHEWSAAREIITRLAVTIDETALREHFLRTALASLPQGKPLSPEALTSSKYGGLSAREREVAVLVAQGKSNREIATSLVVSERTAEAHVSNILGKLGLTTRAQIAAWAVEKRLTSTP
jgi:DNA-binding CsgD family transcriptional regulator/tetratricopeptide (TPR) repeat protein